VSVAAAVAGLVKGIAQASQEQSLALGQVTTAVAFIDQATQQNAEVVQDASAAADGLRAEAEHLTGLVRRFLHEGQAPEAPPEALAHGVGLALVAHQPSTWR